MMCITPAACVNVTMRRTTLLGALVTAATMTNVVMLNFCYDVPVKLYSTHLLLTALVIAAPDLRRLANLLVLNRPVAAVIDEPLFTGRRLRIAAKVCVIGFTALVTLLPLYGAYRFQQQFVPAPKHAALTGLWNVTEQSVDGRLLPPTLAQTTRWQRVIVSPSDLGVETVDGNRQRYRIERAAVAAMITLRPTTNLERSYTLTYAPAGPNQMHVITTIDGHAISAILTKTPMPQFPLTTRGFHWVSEYPYNR